MDREKLIAALRSHGVDSPNVVHAAVGVAFIYKAFCEAVGADDTGSNVAATLTLATVIAAESGGRDE